MKNDREMETIRRNQRKIQEVKNMMKEWLWKKMKDLDMLISRLSSAEELEDLRTVQKKLPELKHKEKKK